MGAQREKVRGTNVLSHEAEYNWKSGRLLNEGKWDQGNHEKWVRFGTGCGGAAEAELATVHPVHPNVPQAKRTPVARILRPDRSCENRYQS